MGYKRPGNRGVGTRNFIVVLGTSSRTTGFARQLATLTHRIAASHDNIDGVVAVAHTEGGSRSEPNNRELLLRTLAGFMVHPNVGAVLAVDYCRDPAKVERFYREARRVGLIPYATVRDLDQLVPPG